MKKLIFLIASLILLTESCKKTPAGLESADNFSYTVRKAELSDLIGKIVLLDLTKKLYEDALQGKIKAYNYDSLTETAIMKADDLKTRGGIEEVIQIAYDPSDPNSETYDSLVVTPFDIDKTNSWFICEKWSFNQEKGIYSANIHSFAPGYKMIVNGIDLGDQPLFWTDFNDLKKYLSEDEFKNLKKAISVTLYNKINLRN